MGVFSSIFGQKVSQVTARPSGITFKVGRSQSILEAALAEGVAFPHSCTVGTCGSCKCRLLSGKIREITNFGYVLSAEELQGDIILACQAAAKTDVELDVPGLEDKRLHPSGDFTGTISASTDLTHDIKHVTLRLDAPIKFDAGQYAHLAVDDVFGARAYSFAMPPQPAGCTEVAFFIRRVPDGMFTELLFSGGLEGKTLKVHGPSGNFWLRESRAPIIAIAGGSGLAPLVSILEHAVAGNVGRPTVFLFGARTQADLYALDRIDAVAQAWNGAFNFVPVLSDEAQDSGWTGARGLVTEHIEAHARELASDQTEAYLCGPPPMIDAAMPVLGALGLAENHIHFDKFLDGSHGLHRQELE